MMWSTRIVVNSVIAIALALTFSACDDNPAGPDDDGDIVQTITITADGVSPKEFTISRGQRVRFVNNDSVSHTMSSDPHPTHTDCPAINEIGLLQPGDSDVTNNMNNVRACLYHDDQRDTEFKFRGTIHVQ